MAGNPTPPNLLRQSPLPQGLLSQRLLLVVLAAAAPIGLLSLGWATGAPTQQEDYRDPTQFPAYFEAGPHVEGYRFTELPLDRNSPFYPSSATTRSQGFYSQEQLMDVERCGDAGCHPDIYDMWFESAHHLASMSDPWYRRTVQFFQERAGVRASQWCGGCHDPALMMTGRMQGAEPIDFEGAGANIGISCQFCHSVDRVHSARANGSYRLAPAAALPHSGTTDSELRRRGNDELLADPELIRRHKARRRSPFHSLSLFCGTCHKQSLITPVNNYKWLRGFDEYDGWQGSGISGGSARSFYYPDTPLQCQDCHMPEVPSEDAGNDDGMVNSHRFLGSNTALPAVLGYQAQLRATVEFLQDDQVTVDIFALRLGPSGAASQLITAPNMAAVSVAPGELVGVEIVVRTRGVGHQFTGGTTDSNMSWLEVSLVDGDGRPVLMSGGMNEERFVDPSAHFYRGLFLDEAGQELDKRNGWDRRAPVYVHAIPPGAADTVHYRFKVPDAVRGALRLRVRLNYRKHKQAYNRWALGAVPANEQSAGVVSRPQVDTRRWEYDDTKVADLPTVILSEAALELVVRAVPTNAPPALLPPQRDDWMRFNDYAIGLLRQGDSRAAIKAFRVVQQVYPEYADGFVNEARAHLSEGNLAEVEAVLEHANVLQPGYFKAAYFQAQAARGFGEYGRAAELLERVVSEFPYDRVVRLDLGNSYYLLGRYDEAIRSLLFVLDQIDPEELGAHYNLMLTYRALGDDAKARVHESRYLRYREDEDIRQLTGRYKREHPHDNNEAQPIHFHELSEVSGWFSAPERDPWTDWLEGGSRFRPAREFPGPLPPWRRTDRATGEQP
jgi:tetratricopeptide (TPR) repeat protein